MQDAGAQRGWWDYKPRPGRAARRLGGQHRRQKEEEEEEEEEAEEGERSRLQARPRTVGSISGRIAERERESERDKEGERARQRES